MLNSWQEFEDHLSLILLNLALSLRLLSVEKGDSTDDLLLILLILC